MVFLHNTIYVIWYPLWTDGALKQYYHKNLCIGCAFSPNYDFQNWGWSQCTECIITWEKFKPLFIIGTFAMLFLDKDVKNMEEEQNDDADDPDLFYQDERTEFSEKEWE